MSARRKVLVFTDLHITQPGRTIIGLDPAARFRAGLAHALARHGDAAAIIVTGDLAHGGQPEEYRRLHGMLADCPLPVHLMLGNHDRRAAFLAAFPATPQTASGHVQRVVDLPDHRLILLDSLEDPAPPERPHAGRLCAARLAWLDEALAGSDGRAVLVFVHHPPFCTGFEGMDAIRLLDDAALLTRLAAAPQVQLLVAGHVHRTISGRARGVSVATFKSPCHQQPMELGPGDTTASVAEPGAYGLLLLGPDGVIVHSEDFTLTPGVVASYES